MFALRKKGKLCTSVCQTFRRSILKPEQTTELLSFDVTAVVVLAGDYAGFRIEGMSTNPGNIRVNYQLEVTPIATPLTGDSFLHKGQKNANEGASHYLVVKKRGRKRTVVGFDLPSVTGSVDKATLTLTLAKPAKWWGHHGRMVDVHRLLEPSI